MPTQPASPSVRPPPIDTDRMKGGARAVSKSPETLRVEAAIATARAKTLTRAPTVRENGELAALRALTARIFARALADTRPHSVAAALRVTRTLVSRWMDPRWSDKRPVPLAILASRDAIGDDVFEAVVAALRESRVR